jgi:hypothetical protein
MNFRDELFSLHNKTEHNLKIVEGFTNEFAVPILNEWRYGSRHIANSLTLDLAEEEQTKALGHWRRAYYDSCDIVLNCQLERLSEYHRQWRGYTDVVKEVISEYAKHLVEIRRIQKIHREAKCSVHGSDRRQAYDSLQPSIDALSKILEEIEANKDAVDCAIRKAKVKHWSAIIVAVTAIVSILPQAANALISWIQGLMK